jgi:hypothetical protein
MEVLPSTQFQRFSKWGLKIPRWQHRAGSIPASGTTVLFFAVQQHPRNPHFSYETAGFLFYNVQ